MKSFGLICAFLAVVSPALAFEKPTGFQNIPFGSTEGFIRELYPATRCSQRMDSYDDILCAKAFPVGDIPLIVTFTLIGPVDARRMVEADLRISLSICRRHQSGLRTNLYSRVLRALDPTPDREP
jgi:hypothetical protein